MLLARVSCRRRGNGSLSRCDIADVADKQHGDKTDWGTLSLIFLLTFYKSFLVRIVKFSRQTYFVVSCCIVVASFVFFPRQCFIILLRHRRRGRSTARGKIAPTLNLIFLPTFYKSLSESSHFYF